MFICVVRGGGGDEFRDMCVQGRGGRGGLRRYGGGARFVSGVF